MRQEEKGDTGAHMTTGATARPKERILIVDDEEAMRELLLALFRKNGLEAAAVPGALDGFDFVAAARPEVVIVDHRLSGGGGVDFIRRVKERFPEVKCLFMTAFDTPDVFREALEAGASDTVRKPFDILTMLGKVRDLLTEPEAPTGEGRRG